MSQPDANLELLLSELKNKFLIELPERCDVLEENILALDNEDSFIDAFPELFRAIHSLKGTGGSMGLPVITRISHQFEDLLTEIDGDFNQIESLSIDTMLAYNDLLKSTALSLLDGAFDEDFVNDELNKLKGASNPFKLTCMYVEESKVISQLVGKQIEGLPIQLTMSNNGLEALERLLNEKFDILITSKELSVLNGVALIYALRHSGSKNEDIPTIITTSRDDDQIFEQLGNITVIKKDKALSENIANKINEFVEQN